MPAITAQMGKMTKEQKAQLVKEFTESAAKITGLPEHAFYIFIDEYEAENVGVGGQLRIDR